MKNTFNMYPVLTQEMIENISLRTDSFEFSYSEDYEIFPLELNEHNGTEESFSAKLHDPRCVWYPDSNNLIIRKSGVIENTEALFGPYGIAASDAVIGVAIVWSSTKSQQRGIIPCGHFVKTTRKFEFASEYRFEKSTIKGSVLLQLVIYLKKSGTLLPDEMHLNNTSGTVYGILQQCEIFIDGNGSVFPISTVNEPGKPLWWVYFDSAADPLNDSFDEENVEIRLNRAHPSFDSLKIDLSLKESPLFIEVLSSALVLIIDSVKETLGSGWESILESQEFAHGSIAEAVYYFIHKLEWDISSPSALSRSIHTYFDKQL